MFKKMLNYSIINDGDIMFDLTYDTKHRAFLTQTTFKIIGLILLGVSQLTLAIYALNYTMVIPAEEIPNSDSALDIFSLIMSVLMGDISGETNVIAQYRDLIASWPEVKNLFSLSRVVTIFLLIGLFSTLVQERKSIKRIIITYAVYTFLFYLFELIGYYFFLFPIVESFGESYMLDETTIYLAEIGISSLMGIFANFNIFIDLLVCTLFFFFVVYTPKKGVFSRHRKVFRSFALIPVLYLVLSVVLSYLGKIKIEIPIPILALFSSKGIYAHVFFWIITIYYKFRRKIYNNNPYTYGLEFKQYIRTNSSKFDFALVMGLIMLVICLFENIFKDLTVAKVFNFSMLSLGRGVYLYCFVFILLFFDFTKKPRFKFFNVLYVIYYLILAFLLFAFYLVIIDYVMNVLKIVSNAITAVTG